MDLSNLSFLHSDISQTKFIACDWGSGYENKKFTERKPSTAGWFHFRRPRLLRDELDWRKAIQKAEPEAGDPTAGDIEVLALQLKQSLEATKDPIAAGDFHFAAMEMKRERAKEQGRKARARTLWAYKMLNGYGERYGRAFVWVVLTWLVFAAAYACLGCPRPAGEGSIDALMSAEWWETLGYSLYYSLENLLPFKFSSHFLKPEGTATHFIAAIETLFGTTLFTFFVLALRRRFKR